MSDEREVRKERTNWRDAEISGRHRLWGFNCPAVDLDFLVTEYNIGKPVGLIEYKRFTAQKPNVLHPTYRALCDLADKYSDGPLPFLIAFYWPEIWAFRIIPVNSCAKRHFQENEVLTEEAFVNRLYKLRNLTLTEFLRGKLSKTLPQKQASQQASHIVQTVTPLIKQKESIHLYKDQEDENEDAIEKMQEAERILIERDVNDTIEKIEKMQQDTLWRP